MSSEWHPSSSLLSEDHNLTRGQATLGRKSLLRRRPSDRIAINLSPAAAHLELKRIRRPREAKFDLNLNKIDVKSLKSNQLSLEEDEFESFKDDSSTLEVSSNSSSMNTEPHIKFCFKSCQRLNGIKCKNNGFVESKKTFHKRLKVESLIDYCEKRPEASLPCSPDTQRRLVLGPTNIKDHDDIDKGSSISLRLIKTLPKNASDPLNPLSCQNIMSRLSFHSDLANLAQMLLDEAKLDYKKACNLSIVDYVLLDPKERLRLNVKNENYNSEKNKTQVTIRAPVSWHLQVILGRQFVSHHLFIGHPVIIRLNVYDSKKIWHLRYARLRFVVPLLFSTAVGTPPSPQELVGKVGHQCQDARAVLLTRWVPECASLLVSMKASWQSLIPRGRRDSVKLAKHFFDALATIMAHHLRSMVMASLEDMVDHINAFVDGNDIDKEGNEDKGSKESFAMPHFIRAPLLRIKLCASKDGSVVFQPNLIESRELMKATMETIVKATMNIRRIECDLFPAMKEQKDLILRAVHNDELLVQKAIKQVDSIMALNMSGPTSFLRHYDRFQSLLNDEAQQKCELFLKDQTQTLLSFKKKLRSYDQLIREIRSQPNSVLLNLFVVDCTEVNQRLLLIAERLRNRLIEYQVDLNRTLNKEICQRFEAMSIRVGVIPEDTAELVALQRFLNASTKQTLPQLKLKIEESAQRVLFLLDETVLCNEDLQLNTRVFVWPEDIDAIFDLAFNRSNERRDEVEEKLRQRIDKFQADVDNTAAQLDAFMKKDPPILTMEEMRHSVQIIDKLETKSESAIADLRSINSEERHLDWDPSECSLLSRTQKSVSLFSSLWHLALEFHEKHEIWFGGPLANVDAEQVSNRIESMHATAIELVHCLEQPSARRIAEIIRNKMEKFKLNLPVLRTVCNPGLRERHWVQIEAANNSGHIERNEGSTLSDMVDAGLNRITDQLDEISAVASKEYALEIALDKMKLEWQNVRLEAAEYRQSGTSVLVAAEDVQQMLDDSILKTQTLHSSPYIGPLESSMKEWEQQLLHMQDVLDAWTRCQAAWQYLEPIFGSDDILKQMPVEGRKFNKVDRIYRSIMARTTLDNRVTVATGHVNMLANLHEANSLLDDIRKGLNNYLERKRVSFPRFFFLANAELLEILAETKDPRRMQNHIHKCFNGIQALHFNENEEEIDEVLGMKSIDNECVLFDDPILPSDSKGVVEKWLLLVEHQMRFSLEREIREVVIKLQDIKDYPELVLNSNQPIQALLCARSIDWTRKCELALDKNDLESLLALHRRQLLALVESSRDHKSEFDCRQRRSATSLIVWDVHLREIMQKLISRTKNISEAKQSFEWARIMRFYDDINKDNNDNNEEKDDDKNNSLNNISINMATSNVNYGYEYVDSSARLVITGLTERSFLSMLTALTSNLGTMIEGVFGVGKSENCKELARICAKLCIVFNCALNTDIQGVMSKMFKGVVGTGGWLVLDEFDRMDTSSLSVVANFVQSVVNAKEENEANVRIDNHAVNLNPNCSFFVTMDSSSALRHSLPSNLRHLFRPLATAHPEVLVVAEVRLLAQGLVHARRLSRHLVDVVQLVQQVVNDLDTHDDNGLRLIVFVTDALQEIDTSKDINFEQGLTKDEADFNREVNYLIKALDSVIKPRLSDLQLSNYESILQEVFTKRYEDSDYSYKMEELKMKVEEVCEEQKLLLTQDLWQKMSQMHALLDVRPGIILVGDSKSGKTCCWSVLAKAIEKMQIQRVTTKVVNPKAQSLDRLMGSFEARSKEWCDGVFGSAFRNMANVDQEKQRNHRRSEQSTAFTKLSLFYVFLLAFFFTYVSLLRNLLSYTRLFEGM